MRLPLFSKRKRIEVLDNNLGFKPFIEGPGIQRSLARRWELL